MSSPQSPIRWRRNRPTGRDGTQLASNGNHPPRVPFVLSVGVTGHRSDALAGESLGALRDRLMAAIRLITDAAIKSHAGQPGWFQTDRPGSSVGRKVLDGAGAGEWQTLLQERRRHSRVPGCAFSLIIGIADGRAKIAQHRTSTALRWLQTPLALQPTRPEPSMYHN